MTHEPFCLFSFVLICLFVFSKDHPYKDANDLLVMQTNLRFSNVHYQSDILFAISPHGFMHRKALRIAHGFSSKVIAERKQAHEEGKAQQSNGRLLPFLDILLQAKVMSRFCFFCVFLI